MTMTLDELAATIVSVEADDLPELGRLHAGLHEVGASAESPEPARALARQAAALVEQLMLRECPDPGKALAEVSRAVCTLQEIAGGSLDDPGPAASADSDGAEAGDADAESSDGEAPAPAGPAESAPVSAACEIAAADADLLGEFVTESMDHLEQAEASLLELEANPDDADSINAVFRAFHTIKGASGFLGLSRINAVAHKAETLLDRARQGELRLEGSHADLALEATDALKRLMQQARSGLGGEPGPDPEGLDDLIARLEHPEAAAEPAPDPMRVGDVLVAKGLVSRRKLEQIAKAEGTGRIGEKLIKAGVVDARQVAQALRVQQVQKAAVTEATLRVGMRRLDSLIDMVGELVIVQSMVSQDPVVRGTSSQALSRKVSQLGKITRELQDVTLSMRMVPLKSTFQKMARLVRDVARKSSKQVQFVCEGEETEIDRNMVEGISDPLIHMMRNAVDHGVEAPAARQRQGKSETGQVRLAAYHEAGEVVIEVSDDGAGLDPDRLLAKAVERGVVEPSRELSRGEIFELLFVPGFSTAEKVTDVSGRGVGMDVVKRNIEAQRGRVEVDSVPGAGTTFKVRLPLTLAIIDGMLLRVGAERYVLPTITIQQAFRPEPGAVSSVTGRGEVVMFQGHLLPIFRLSRLFGVDDAVEGLADALLVVVEAGGQRCAVAVDELLGQQQVVIKSLGEGVGRTVGVSGGAILADGTVGLILDAQGLIELAHHPDGIPRTEHEALAVA